MENSRMNIWTVFGRNYRIITNGTRFRIERQGRFFRKRWHILHDDGYIASPLEWNSRKEAEDYIRFTIPKIRKSTIWQPVED